MYHVTLRGNHQQDIFFTATDRCRMSELFADVSARFGARLHAYCYMTNHLHALIQVSDVPLGRLMLRIAGQYARSTQARLQTCGHLFEKRYHPMLVDTDVYLRELLRYMHLNPVRAGLALRPESYPWSSHHVYLGARDEPWVTTDFALAQFGADRERAVRAYADFVRQARLTEQLGSPLAQRNPNDRRILGSDDFARRMLGAAWRPRARKPLDCLVDEACAHFAVTAAELASPSRKPRIIAARAWVANEAVQGGVASVAAVARLFGRDESSLRRALRKRFAGA
jgi:putative transposase